MCDTKIQTNNHITVLKGKPPGSFLVFLWLVLFEALLFEHSDAEAERDVGDPVGFNNKIYLILIVIFSSIRQTISPLNVPLRAERSDDQNQEISLFCLKRFYFLFACPEV